MYVNNLNWTLEQSGDTELSGIPLDLGEFEFFHLGDSPRSGGIYFVQFTKISKMGKIDVL